MNPHRISIGLTLTALLALAGCDASIFTRSLRVDSDSVPDDPMGPVKVDVPEEPACTGGCVGFSGLPRLTALEYQNSIFDVFGLYADIAQLPIDGAIGGTFFTNDQTSLLDSDVDRYRASAETNADFLMTQSYPASDAVHSGAPYLDVLLSAVPACSTRNGACAAGFVAHYASRLYRRPLTADETTAYARLYEWTRSPADETLTGGAGGTFDDGMRYTLEQMLQAPGFLYRAELGAPTAPDPGIVALSSHEVAARLAAFVLRSVPDAELMAAADRDELRTPEQVAMQARRLLNGPNGDRLWWFFAQDWLSTRKMPDASAQSLPEAQGLWSDRVAKDLTFDVHLTFARLAREDGRLKTVFTSPGAVIQGDSLAPIIGANGARWSWAPEVPHRHGVLTLPGVLIANGHPGYTHAHQRGLFVRLRVLCQTVGSPGPELAAAIATVQKNEQQMPSAQTDRGRLERVTESAAVCRYCHHLTNPIGYALDGLDNLGRHRDTQLGLDGVTYPVDTSGELIGRDDGTLTTDIDGKFSQGTELLDRLAESTTVARCMTRQMSRFALQREVEHDDQPSLDAAFGVFDASGRDLRELVVALTGTEAFLHRRVAQDGQVSR